MENSAKKTKKVVKRRLKIKGVLFLACLFFVGYLIVAFLLNIEVQAVYVEGNTYLKDSQIIKATGLNDDVAFLGFRSKTACESALEDPFIRSCKIKRRWNFKVEIIIEENVPLFYYAPQNAIVLSDGSMESDKGSFGVPTLVNMVPEKVLNRFITGLSKVKSDIIRSISEIEYSPTMASNGVYIDEERFIMSMNDGNTVYINNRKLSVLNIYDTIYASIGDKKGIFNCDCDEDTCIFTKYGE